MLSKRPRRPCSRWHLRPDLQWGTRKHLIQWIRAMMAADSRRTTAVGTGQLAELRPTRSALARMAAALRGVIAVVAVASALLGAGPPLLWWWLVSALVAVACWTSVYVAVAWTR